ncbi:Sensor protein ZraS [Methylophilaceae bacterium]|nr:Sensor protein ZraS [Methylophilaceae bacterium]
MMSIKPTELLHRYSLGLLLLSLHAVLIWGFETPLQKAFLICHYGFFLLWQPIWRTRQALSLYAAALFIAGGLLLVYFMSWWLMAFWLAGLFGLLGGRVFSILAKNRLAYLLATSYLLASLLLWVVPKLLDADVTVTEFLMMYLLPLLPVFILFASKENHDSPLPPTLDFFYTLLLLLLAVILVLGSFVIEASSGGNYAEVLIRVLFGLAIALFVISWLWNPRAGFAGIGQLLSRYLLSLGLPFEQWVKNIAELAEHESSSKEFTQSAMREIATLPWVSGVSWNTAESNGELGVVSQHHALLDFQGVHMKLYTRFPLTPALAMHVKLLTQILGEFYEAKRREESMRQNTYMQAVYETGARLTHDIKNIVQSLSGLCRAAELTGDEDNERLVALIRRQLPQLNQRLSLTLDKLQAPNKVQNRIMKLETWWSNIRQRYQQTQVAFLSGPIPELDIDDEVLDSVLDNLLQNAIEKAKNETGTIIEVEMSIGDKLCIEVTDSGKAMPQEKAETLFKKHVSSENGLGIGLYHAGRQAGQAGYSLSLVNNQDGEVRFRLIQVS